MCQRGGDSPSRTLVHLPSLPWKSPQPIYIKKRGAPGANKRPFVRRFHGFLFPPGAPLRRGGVKSWGTPPNPRGGRPHFPPATHVRSSRGCPVGPVKVVASLRSAKRGRLATVSHVSEARSVETKQARVRGTSYRHIYNINIWKVNDVSKRFPSV